MENHTPNGEPKPTLLIVDDDQGLCAMLVEYVTLEGFNALTAATGPAGLEQLARTPVDLVILDVMLPELSGFEVLRAHPYPEPRARHHAHRPRRGGRSDRGPGDGCR